MSRLNKPLQKKFIYNLLFITIACLLFEIILYNFASQALAANVENSLLEMASKEAKIVETDYKLKLKLLEMMASLPIVGSAEISTEDKLHALTMNFKHEEFRRVSIADLKGNAMTTDGRKLYVGDREYFRKALNGTSFVSDPIISRNDGDSVISYAVPIYTNGKISGVMYATHSANELYDMINESSNGSQVKYFIINGNGEAIANKNWLTATTERGSYALLIGKMMQRTPGIMQYSYKGTGYYVGFSPISGTEWVIGAAASKKALFRKANETLSLIILLAFVLLVVFSAMRSYTYILHRKLVHKQDVLNTAIDTANIISIEIDKSGSIVEINKYAEIKTGYSRLELISQKTIYELSDSENAARLMAVALKIKDREVLHGFSLSLKCKNDKLVHVLWSIKRSDSTEDKRFELLGVDISERVEYENRLLESHEELVALYEELSASEEELKQKYMELSYHQELTRKSEERFRLSSEGSKDILWDWDITAKTMYFSDRWKDLMGYQCGGAAPDEEVWRDIIHPEDFNSFKSKLEVHFAGEVEMFEAECRLITADKSYKWFYIRGKARYDQNNRATRICGSLTDITERKENELRIYKLAYNDSLTGLPNRQLLEEVVREAVEVYKISSALAFIDLDNFKYINDTFGHSLGDELLINVGQRLKHKMNENSLVSRLGGDEFAILVKGIESETQVRKFALDIINSLNVKFSAKGVELPVSASMGIAFYPKHGRSLGELLKNADTAMYKAKSRGKNQVVVFDYTMNSELYEKVKLESSLRNVVENNELMLHYQPVYCFDNGKVCRMEALVRWNSPVYGLVPPSKFIPVAEENGMIFSIGKWVLAEACKFAKKLNDLLEERIIVSVNISVCQLSEEDFINEVMETIQSTGIEACLLELEITESVLMENIESNLRKIKVLRDFGLSVALDDFGSGYSSLTYLRKLPISTLKIEKSFIDDITSDQTKSDIAISIIKLAHTLGLKVVAEGVETEEQFNSLNGYSCDLIQGYYISKPLPEGDILSMVKSQDQGVLS